MNPIVTTVILFTSILYVFFVMRARQRHSQRRRYWNRKDPIHHARTGVSRGEISLEEFDEIKKTIRTREDRNHRVF